MIKYGNYGYLMKPLGAEKKVLEKAGVTVQEEVFMF
jgi:hypothetical protein